MHPRPREEPRPRTAGEPAELAETYRILFEESPIPMWVFAADDLRFLEVNAAAVREYGWSRAEFLAMSIRDIRPPDDIAALEELVARRERHDNAGVWRHLNRAGEERLVRVTSHGVRFRGVPARLTVCEDVTARLAAQDELRRQKAFYEDILDNTEIDIVAFDTEGRFQYVNRHSIPDPAMREWLVGHTNIEYVAERGKDPEMGRRRHELIERAVKSGETIEFEEDVVTRDGDRVWIVRRHQPVRDADGRVVRVLGFGWDATQRKLAELEAQARERAFKALVENSPQLVARFAADLRPIYVNPTVERVTGLPAERLLGAPIDAWPLQPDAARRLLAALHDALDLGETVRLELDVGPAEQPSSLLVTLVPESAAADAAATILFTAQDLTERRALEEQLRQAHKMEAVGRLAGGIAHDFNNILTAIQGSAHFALDAIPPDGPAADDVRDVIAGAERAAELVHQLLAFSRRQMLQPRTFDLNAAVASTERLLRRLLPATIELRTLLAAGLPPVRADRVQLEQVLLNLVVNARDAMPDGGLVEVATSLRAEDDDDDDGAPWVELRVRDSGVGMDEHTRSHLFEPFFTTKEQGKGTGMGMAMIYGIVKQSGGDVLVRSEPGRGTEIRVLLPAATP